ncbi:MAG: FGGY family carbohydrate kinase [Candidatus Caldatribacterium sp.]|uniref:FGGY family carbohydrate kinase n=1 Tax=Candidatus Caldatribacterium sp. TaxID=2282143 RepID=UPI002998A707|nr:FGGY family carbohydrate kinase [Candidatus Caldatribacterium sp.]MCX7731129.1 FGGY family carbohydrate kinase [Candidatus Caldatribacterium sp.]MDW8080839.1 FGGY family carbohydrate kinase [Candidatus Calescibacterium sp.]
MEKNEYFMVLDCGATSIRAVALHPQGRILSLVSFPNAPKREAEFGHYLIWDLEEIWEKVCQATRKIVAEVGRGVRAVSVTTFGADGAPVREDGSLTYPVISWQCSRTENWTKRIIESVSAREIFRITGYQVIPFNTLLKLLWLRENAPQALDEAKCFLMMPGLLNFRLTGEMTMDYTIASTTMMFDIQERRWSDRLLSLAGLRGDFFPRMVESGEVIGTVTARASEATGIPVRTPVTSAGHDTQFAIIGSLARENELVLSSGTWEIAALRIPFFRDSEVAFATGMLVELDAEKGFWNPQMLMIAGGVVEWVRRNFFADCKDAQDVYERIIEAASSVSPGAEGIFFIPSFMPSGPLKPYGTRGTILGLGLTTQRAQIARAVFEGLSFQLRQAVDALFEAFGFRPERIVVVGGGSKNALWNQIRADVVNLPVVVTSCEEATVLGAALFAMVGIGYVKNLQEAKENIIRTTRVFEPSPQRAVYDELFARYVSIPRLLEAHYREYS